MSLPDPEKQRLAIWGAGREGLACLSWLRRRHPQAPLEIWDDSPDALQQPMLQQDPGLHLRLLAADQPLPEADWIIKSPGISRYQPRIQQALARGSRLTTGSNLWRRLQPAARVLGVTGTKGKSTTSALLAHLLRALGQRVILAGNIGQPLLATPEARADWWVVEFSSYQLADLDWTPQAALLLNLEQEHLDWHGSLARYRQDKLRIFGPEQLRVHPPGLPLPEQTGGRWLAYDTAETVHRRGGYFCLADQALYPLSALPLPGVHNQRNACAALTLLHGLGFDLAGLEPALRGFQGLPHRLQTVCEQAGIRWVNDSIATTPEASLAALEAFSGQPVVLIVGGHDRGLDWSAFQQALLKYRPLQLLALPESGHRLAREMRAQNHPVAISPVRDLAEAVAETRARLAQGGVCLFSPGSPSQGPFRNFEERGAAFSCLACPG